MKKFVFFKTCGIGRLLLMEIKHYLLDIPAQYEERYYQEYTNSVYVNLNRPQGNKPFLCSTQLSTTFQLLIKSEIPTNEEFLALSLTGVVFIMLINVKMQTIVGILTFMSRIISCSAELSMKNVLKPRVLTASLL